MLNKAVVAMFFGLHTDLVTFLPYPFTQALCENITLALNDKVTINHGYTILQGEEHSLKFVMFGSEGILRQLPKHRNIPLLVSKVIDKIAHGLFRDYFEIIAGIRHQGF